MSESPTKHHVPAPVHVENHYTIKEKDSSDAEVARTWSKGGADEDTEDKNPLAGLTKEDLLADVEAFAREKNLEHILGDLKRGALVAQDPRSFEALDELSEDEKVLLRREKTHRWSQPFMMYFMTSQFWTPFGHEIILTSVTSPLCGLRNCARHGSDGSQRGPRVCASSPVLLMFWVTLLDTTSKSST